MKLIDALRLKNQNRLDKPAVLFENQSLTYADLLARSESLAKRLEKLNVGVGSIVCGAFDNAPAFLITLLAVTRVGAAFASLDMGLTRAEAKGLLDHCQASMIVTSAEGRETFQGLTPLLLTLDGFGAYEGEAVDGDARHLLDAEIGLLQFSSGTTGRPKAALITRAAMLYRAEYLIPAIGLSEVDETLCALPLSHTHGLECLALPTLLAGGTLHLYQPKFAYPLYILQELALRKITFFSSIPQFYDFAVKLPAAASPDLSTLKFPFCGSAALAKATAEAFFIKYGVQIKQGYGLVELPVICLNHHRTQPIYYDSVGHPLDGVEWKILGDAHEGELIVRSRSLFHSYLDNPVATALKLCDGWLHTGDRVSVDADGFIRIVGRMEDFIKVGGFKVYAAEVESALISLPEVQECAVLGSTDESRTETIVAYIVTTPGTDSRGLEARLMAGLRPLLSDYKIPRKFHFETSLPKSRLGKIAKTKISSINL